MVYRIICSSWSTKNGTGELIFLETILNVLSDIQELCSCWLAGAKSSLVFNEV